MTLATNIVHPTKRKSKKEVIPPPPKPVTAEEAAEAIHFQAMHFVAKCERTVAEFKVQQAKWLEEMGTNPYNFIYGFE